MKNLITCKQARIEALQGQGSKVITQKEFEQVSNYFSCITFTLKLFGGFLIGTFECLSFL